MADSGTQDASIALYQYMCEKIVGTEEEVKTTRMMNAAKDNFGSSIIKTIITSGSFGEGLEMRGSDIDIITVIPFVEVCENVNLIVNPNVTYFEMATEDAQPGYTQLRLAHCKNDDILEHCKEIGGERYISNILIKQHFLHKLTPNFHGPCVTDPQGYQDFAFGLHSKSWISQGEEWITRSNNPWPGYKVKQSIINHGVLFVPKGVKGSTKEEFEWRISFSVGEKFLIFSFTHTQLLCYALLKILLKDLIDIDLDCNDLLCSYFMKTLLFWISEEFPPTIWRPGNLIHNFIRCIRRLIYYVEHSVCPHFFIPDNNLFWNKVRGHAQKKLLQKLKSLYRHSWQSILQSDQFKEFSFNIHKVSVPLYNSSLKVILSANGCCTDDLMYDSPSFLASKIQMILYFRSSKLKHIYSMFISNMCFQRVQKLPIDLIHDNKSTYKQYKTCLSNLMLNLHHDAVSGWLLVASFFYKTKQYNIALEILHYSLFKCSEEKLYEGIDLSPIHHEIFSLNEYRQMGIVKLIKLMRVKQMHFIQHSTFIPDEFLKHLGKNIMNEDPNIYTIPPVAYAHFLSFLCHYHLNNSMQCRHSQLGLQTTIEREYFIANAYEKALSYNVLGLVLQLSGDKEAATQAFIESMKLVRDRALNIAWMKFALMGWLNESL